MKTAISILFITFTYHLSAQILVRGVSPSSIDGMNFDFRWADPTAFESTWYLTPDFNEPNTFIQGNLELVVDNSHTGNSNAPNTTQHPLANEGCLTTSADAYSQPSLVGKIAVLWRGSCQFGLKALLAEENGAIGVIIINHSGDPIGMLGGDTGAYVTIPVVMISTNDGQFLLNEMTNGPVELFMGNKLGSVVNDIGSYRDLANISRYGSIPIDMANNGYSFDIGITVNNNGTVDNTPIIKRYIDGPNGQIYYDSLNLGPINSFEYIDTLYQTFTASNMVLGEYNLNYELSIENEIDEDPGDNIISSSFHVTNNILSLARTDPITGDLVANYFPSNANSSYKSCMKLQDTFPDESAIDGVYFTMSKIDSSVSDEYVMVEFYEWNASWTTIQDTVSYDNLDLIGYGEYYCTNDSLNKKMIFTELDQPIILVNNQRYLICLSTENPELSFGYDNGVDYNSNYYWYYQPVGAINIDENNWYARWVGADAPSIGLNFVQSSNIEEENLVDGILYPNPTKSEFNIKISNAKGKAIIMIHDMSGRLVKSISSNNIELINRFDINDLNNGYYSVKVNLENNKTINFNMIVNK